MTRLKQDLHYWLIIFGLLLLTGYFAWTKGEIPPPNSPHTAYDADEEHYDWEISEFARGLEVPWDIAFTPDGEMFITERAGKLKLRKTDGTLTTVAELNQVAQVGESGLTGMVLHPDFGSNHRLYLYYTYRDAGEILNRVSQYTYANEAITNERAIIDRLPGGSIHNGGRLAFGRDGKLWVLTGDAARPNLAQDKTSLAGKVLRANDDGSVPNDNPTPGSLVYSLGHRNPQGLDWHPLTEELLVTSHGETAHDEINLVTPNSNHGWPVEKKCNEQAPYTPPILCSGQETWAPSAGVFWGSDPWRFRYSFFFTGLRSGKLQRIAVIDGKVAEQEVIIDGTYGRLRGATKGPDNALYITTSNHDGRGKPQPGDDKVLKLTPKLKSN